MPHFYRAAPDFWHICPPALKYTRVFAEAVDHRVASFVLGDNDDAEAPLALFMNLPPGWVLDRHAHDCHRFEVVIEGLFIVSGGRTLGPGDVSTSNPGEPYGPHMAGPEGVLTLEVFSRQAGLYPIRETPMRVDDRMTVIIDELREGLISPDAAAQDPAIMEWANSAIVEQANLHAEVQQALGDSDPTAFQPESL